MKGEPCKTVLVLEDDPDDVFFLRRAFKENNFTGNFVVLDDGQEGVDYVSGAGVYSNRTQHPFPDILITDLKMPRLNGFEVLRWLKKHPQFMVIPAIVLSASAEERDLKEAYCLGANAYLTKPAEPLVRREMVRKLIDFWSTCHRPKFDTIPCGTTARP